MTSTPNQRPSMSRRHVLSLGAAGAGAALVGALPGAGRAVASPVRDPLRRPWSPGEQTIGGGSIAEPALGPPPAYGTGSPDMTLVKNWNFGTNGTVPDIETMNAEFVYHDQFGTIDNGGNYGAVIVAPDAATAIAGQPVHKPSSRPVRAFKADSLHTYLVPLNGATTVTPTSHNVGCGSFMARYTVPNGGKLLGKNLLWETRVRYVTPRYFWFAIWTSGNIWNNGAEIDVIESFGYNNGGGFTNYEGHYWHSNTAGGLDCVNYSDWAKAMAAAGITSYNAAAYHTWQLFYNADDTYQVRVDGIVVQSGKIHWTVGGKKGGQPINMYFLFDAGWGHTQVASVDHSLPASDLAGKRYEWDYSRIYLSDPGPTTYYSLVNGHSGKALSVDNSGVLNGDGILQWEYEAVPSQQWALRDAGDGYKYLVNRNSGKVLSIRDSSTANGGRAIQWANLGAPAEKWKLEDAGDGYKYLVNRNSGKVLSIRDSNTNNGGKALQWANVGAPAEKWKLTSRGT